MGNSHTVPRDGGERLSDYVRRLFKNKTDNVDKLVSHALKEEQKRQKKERKEKGFWRRLKKRLKADDKNGKSDVHNEDFQSMQDELAEVNCDHCNTEEKGECSYFNDITHEEKVIDLSRNKASDNQNENMTIGTSSPSTSRRFLRSGESPVFHFHIPPKFDWRLENSNRRGVRDMCYGKGAFWTEKDYGSDALFDDNLAYDSDNDNQTPDEVLGELNKNDKDRDILSPVTETNRNVETENNIDLTYTGWTVFQKRTTDIYYNIEASGNALEQIWIPLQYGLNPSQQLQRVQQNSADNAGISDRRTACILNQSTNRELETNTQLSTSEGQDRSCLTDIRQPKIAKAAELSPTLAPSCLETETNNDKNVKEITENGGYIRQISDVEFERCFYDSKTRPSELGLTRIERYLARKKHTRYGSDRLDTILSPTKQKVVSHDIPSSPVSEITTQTGLVLHDIPLSPVLEITTRQKSVSHNISSTPVEDLITQPKRVLPEIALSPVLAIPFQQKRVSHEIPISLILEITTQPKRVTLGDTKLDEYPLIKKSTQCAKCGHENVRGQSYTKGGQLIHMDYTTNTTTNNDKGNANPKAADSCLPFAKAKYNDTERAAIKVNQNTQIENDIASDSLRENRINENKTIEKNAQTEAMKCMNIEIDNTHKSYDKTKEIKGLKDTKAHSTTNRKNAEAFFVSCGPSAFNGMANAEDVKEDFRVGFPSQAKSHSEIKLENSEKTKDKAITNNLEGYLDKTATNTKKAEAFFVSCGPLAFNDINTGEDFGKGFPSKTKQNSERTNKNCVDMKDKTIANIHKGYLDQIPNDTKKAETFFVSCEPLTFHDMKLGKGFPSKAKPNTETKNENSGNIKDKKISSIPESNTDKIQTNGSKAEAFFVSFEPSTSNSNGLTNDVKINFEKRFPNKMKHNHNQTKTDNVIRNKTFDNIQTKDDPWKTNSLNDRNLQTTKRDFDSVSKPTQYGSVAHNNSIKSDNALRKQKIQGMQTKVDSWKTNEKDEDYLHPNMRNYTLAPKPAQYGSVEHNSKIKRDNAMQSKKIGSIQTQLDTWKTKEPDYSYLQPKMRSYKLASKKAEYGSVEHNNQIKKDNAMRKMKIGKIQTNLDTWNSPNPGSKYSLQRRDEWEQVLDHKKYGTAAHFHQIKSDNSTRQKRLSKIQTNLDTWNAPNPGSKYSLQRRDEWETVLDHKKYGTAAHFHQIKSDNSARQKRLSKIRTNLDTWNAPNPGSKYSLQRKDEWEPVYDTGKYGSVAHFHQVRETNAESRYMIKNARTKVSTWQPKSKMKLLNSRRQETHETTSSYRESLTPSLMSVRSEIDTGIDSPLHNNHSLSSWSRYNTYGSVTTRRSLIPVRKGTQIYRNALLPKGVPGQFQN